MIFAPGIPKRGLRLHLFHGYAVNAGMDALREYEEMRNRIRVTVVSADDRMGDSMSADRCRQLAAECLRLAQDTVEASDKALLLEMAERWRLLATQFEARQEALMPTDVQKSSDTD